jgi:RNA polymerase sigma factor CnrH
MESDATLMRKLADGEEMCLNILIDRHRPTVFRFAWRYLGNAADAADVTAETFVRLFFAADRYQTARPFGGWLFGIAANLCRDQLRRRQRRPLTTWFSGQSAVDLATDGVDGRSAIELAEVDQLVERAIQELPHTLKVPVIHCLLEGNSQQSCADLMGTTVRAVEARIHRARQRLDAKLALWLKA